MILTRSCFPLCGIQEARLNFGTVVVIGYCFEVVFDSILERVGYIIIRNNYSRMVVHIKKLIKLLLAQASKKIP
jgi:hypothetical protein